MDAKNYLELFAKHYTDGAALFLQGHDDADKQKADLGLGVCATAQEIMSFAQEMRTHAKILEALDDKGRLLITPVVAERLDEIVLSAKRIAVRYAGDTAGTEGERIRADVIRFIDTLESARSMAAGEPE